jgi:hypothetical protein
MSTLIKISLTAFLLCILASCDMFSSRAVTSPSTSTESDPSNLAQILTLSGEKFSKTDYEDICHPNFTFIGVDNQTFTRTSFISRLNLISSKYDTVITTWDTTNLYIKKGDTALTLGRKYKVQFKKSGVEYIDSGKVELDIQYYSVQNTYTILQWRELTSNSFFNPQFSN